jgi:hypothetical protein
VQALPAGFTDRVGDLVDAGAGRVDFGTHHGLSDDRGGDLPDGKAEGERPASTKFWLTPVPSMLARPSVPEALVQ